MSEPATDGDPFDECYCGDYRHQHHDLGCTHCPSPVHADSYRRFQLAFRAGERDAARQRVT